MGVCAANMRKCDIKAKCYFGPNEGEAYDPKNPCCGVGTFNPATCDCEDGCYGPGLYAITWDADYTGTARTNCNSNPDCNVDCDQEIIECGPVSLGNSFFWNNPYPVSCIVPRFFDPFTDVCGEERLSNSANIFACPQGEDPDFGACGPALDGFNPSGCSRGAIDASYVMNVLPVEEPEP